MSVLITIKFPGDVETFRATLRDRGPELAAIAERAKAQGGLHHRFGVGEGFVVVVDEWESVAHFEAFFQNPELQAFIASAGAAGAPEITVSEAVSSPDQY
jgi:quinol monooxygenase YgiN